MTAEQTHSPRPQLGGSHESAFRLIMTAGEWIRRLLIAFAVIVAAGLLAVVTAVFGLVLAAIAVLMRFTGRAPDMAARRQKTQPGTVTLDARPSPRGWTVE